MLEPPAAYAGEATVRAFLDTLEQQCSGYCLLAGYEELPATVSSDIDFMVGRGDFDRLPQVLQSFAKKNGFRLVQEIRHATTARRYEVVRAEAQRVLYLPPDACSDYRRGGRLWLRADKVLARRRKHANGFWIPAADDEFIYYLIKRLEKQKLESQHTERLSRLYLEDPEACDLALSHRLPPSSAKLVADAARNGDWQAVSARLHGLFKDLLAKAPSESLVWRFFGEPGRLIRRWLRPTGVCVAILGPDGSGKSSVIEQYQRSLQPGFGFVKNLHLRPRMLRGSTGGGQAISTDPHGSKDRGALASSAKLLYLWVDYVAGYYIHVRPSLVRSGMVIFDRYYHDLLIDKRRFRYGGPKWLAELISLLIPMPELMLVLDAPAEVLQARKQEVSAEESARQSDAYRAIVNSGAGRGRTVLIDASRPLEEVVHNCTDQTLAMLARRTARRLRLEGARDSGVGKQKT